jgi:methylated-DNA-[protein]-cysteine S-methyltransferase
MTVVGSRISVVSGGGVSGGGASGAGKRTRPMTATAKEYAAKLRTPFAVLGLRSDGKALTAVCYLPLSERARAPGDHVAKRAAREIAQYLRDPSHRIDVPLAPRGTPFQRRVWEAVAAIPLGESRTYAEIARAVGSAPRAVGQACGANPLALVVPCHRVVGSRGSLGGFMNAAAGDPIAIKRWLLTHEGYRFGR